MCKQAGATGSTNGCSRAGDSSVLVQKSLWLNLAQHKGWLWAANQAQRGGREMLDNLCALNWFAYRRCVRAYEAVAKSQSQSSQGRCCYHPDIWLCVVSAQTQLSSGSVAFLDAGKWAALSRTAPKQTRCCCQQRGCMSGGISKVLRVGKVISEKWLVGMEDQHVGLKGLTASKGSHLELTWESATRGEPSCSLEGVHGRSIQLVFFTHMGRSNRAGQADWTMYAMTKNNLKRDVCLICGSSSWLPVVILVDSSYSSSLLWLNC